MTKELLERIVKQQMFGTKGHKVNVVSEEGLTELPTTHPESENHKIGPYDPEFGSPKMNDSMEGHHSSKETINGIEYENVYLILISTYYGYVGPDEYCLSNVYYTERDGKFYEIRQEYDKSKTQYFVGKNVEVTKEEGETLVKELDIKVYKEEGNV